MHKLILGALLLVPSFSFAKTGKHPVDLKASSFQWKASKKIGGGHNGKIFLKSAHVLKSGPKKQIVGAEFVMDMASFTVEDLKGKWRDKFLGHVKSADFFEVKKFPTAKLVVNQAPKKGKATAKLTIKGKTNPVKVAFKTKGNQYTGTLKFNRTKFGMVYGSKSFFKQLVADKIINDEVTVDFKVLVK